MNEFHTNALKEDSSAPTVVTTAINFGVYSFGTKLFMNPVFGSEEMKMKSIKKQLVTILVAVVLGAFTAAGTMAATTSSPSQGGIAKKVRHELVTLPYYGVFDNLAYKVDGGTVTLYGQVVHDSTRREAQSRVSSIEGVQRVINNIQVLPLSSMDNSIRLRTYRAIARTGGLYRYMMGANPSIHIVVDRGRVTLEGVVSNNADRQLAYMAANQVPGVFAVRNNLRTDREIAS